jgi:hypothetical protein
MNGRRIHRGDFGGGFAAPAIEEHRAIARLKSQNMARVVCLGAGKREGARLPLVRRKVKATQSDGKKSNQERRKAGKEGEPIRAITSDFASALSCFPEFLILFPSA